MVSTVPLAPAPKTTPPLLPVAVNDKVPCAVIVPDVVMAALLETEKLFPLDAPEPTFNVAPPVPIQLTSPVVLAVKLVVVPVKVLISPEPDLRFKLVDVIEPPV